MAWPTASTTPLSTPPKIAPRQPATALPNTPPAPPPKNSMIIGGTSTNQPVAAKRPMSARNTKVEARKPIMTEVGARVNTTGRSRAGFVPGRAFSDRPLNAGTISARNIRTPNSRIAMPAAKRSACRMAQTHGSTVIPAICSSTTADSAKSTAISMITPMTVAVETLMSLKNETGLGRRTFSESCVTGSPSLSARAP